LSDLRVHGPALWARFTAPMEGTLWYYRALVQAFASHGRTPLVDELDITVTVRALCPSSSPSTPKF